MKTTLKKIAAAMLVGIMFLCVFCGLILMMCESDDWQLQKLSLALGFALFLIGIVPGLIISLWGSGHDYD